MTPDGRITSMLEEVSYLGDRTNTNSNNNDNDKKECIDPIANDSVLQIQPRSLLSMMTNVGVHLMTSVKSLKNNPKSVLTSNSNPTNNLHIYEIQQNCSI